jgi:hypothetical protein
MGGRDRSRWLCGANFIAMPNSPEVGMPGIRAQK